MSSVDSQSEQFKAQLMAQLKVTIRIRGQSMASVERKLGRGRGYVTDALGGRKTLTLDLVIEVLQALHINPESFFLSCLTTGSRIRSPTTHDG